MVSALLAGKRVNKPVSCENRDLLALGLLSDESSIWLPSDVQAIERGVVLKEMSSRARRLWPNVEVCPVIGSTNSALMALGQDAKGRILVTEYQFGGRGRRGRRWLSPLGRNLCFSLGLQVPGTLDRLAGLSLVVGLAVADALLTAEVPGVRLKWPNDLIVMTGDDIYAKLGGILVELQSHPETCTAVLGIGLNFGGAAATRPGVNVALADIVELRPSVGRVEILVAVLNSLADYLENFLEQGFSPMKLAWNRLHAFHNRKVSLYSGSASVNEQELAQPLNSGTVLGITDTGRLVVRTADSGDIKVDAGEVSLRRIPLERN